MMKQSDTLHCELVRDLLPLYCEGRGGTETRRVIEEHLEGCPECSKLLDQIRKKRILFQKEPEQKQNNKVRPMTGFSRRNMSLSAIIALALIFLIFWISFVPFPADIREMEQTLLAAEELNYITGEYESEDGTTGTLSEESREQNIREFNAKVEQYCSRLGRPFAVFQENHEDLINRVNLEIPQVYRIDHQVEARGLPFTRYRNHMRQEVWMTLRFCEMGLSVEYDSDQECWNVRFGYWNPKCKALFIKEDGKWKILEMNEPNTYTYYSRPDERRLIRLVGQETVEKIHQTTQQSYHSFAEARSAAAELQKLVFPETVSS